MALKCTLGTSMVAHHSTSVVTTATAAAIAIETPEYLSPATALRLRNVHAWQGWLHKVMSAWFCMTDTGSHMLAGLNVGGYGSSIRTLKTVC